MAEIGASTTGQPQTDAGAIDRLFVPLAHQPFRWFQSGEKKWELRRFGRQYTPKHVRVGRRVELRKGYKGPDALWGKILDVIQAKNVDDFFNKVPFKDVIPIASSREDAVKIATNILNVDPDTPLLGFAVDTR
jgi:ASC-1-like (ASCH) protein